MLTLNVNFKGEMKKFTIVSKSLLQEITKSTQELKTSSNTISNNTEATSIKRWAYSFMDEKKCSL